MNNTDNGQKRNADVVYAFGPINLDLLLSRINKASIWLEGQELKKENYINIYRMLNMLGPLKGIL